VDPSDPIEIWGTRDLSGSVACHSFHTMTKAP
jgi:hypothetical protein